MQPLLYAALAFALGIAATGVGPAFLRQPGAELGAGLAAAGLLAAAAASQLRWPRVAGGLALAACVCLGGWRARVAMNAAPNPTAAVLARVQPGARDRVWVSGYLRDSPDARDGALRFDLEMAALQADARGGTEAAVYPASGGLRVYWYAAGADPDAPEEESGSGNAGGGRMPAGLEQLHAGDGIAVRVHVRAMRSVHDPGVPDPARAAAAEDLQYEATLGSDWQPRPDLSGPGESPLRARLWGWMSARLDRLAPPGAQPRLNALLRGMLLGDLERLDEATRTDFQADGVYHLLVVAGLHIGILAAALLGLFGALRLPRFAAEAATLGLLGGYAWVIAGRTPTLRALTMLAVYFLARLWYRERSPLNAVGIAALLLLAHRPLDLFTAGWQMSLGAGLLLAGIVQPVLSRTLEPLRHACLELASPARDETLPPRLAQFRIELRMLAERLGWLWHPLGWRLLPGALRAGLRVAELAVVALVLQIGFAGFNDVYFHRLNPFSVIANLALVPLAGVLIPAAWVALALPLAPLAGAVRWMGQLLLAGAAAMARWPGAEARVPVAPNWMLLLFAAAVALWLAGAARNWRGAAAGGALAALLATAMAVAPFPPRLPAGLSVTVLDVGQGDAIFVAFPDQRTLLVDAGPRTAHWDSGEEIVAPFLWSLGLRRLDAMVLTHAHMDHLGGMATTERLFHPAELWVTPTLPTAVPELRALLSQARADGVRIRQPAAGAEYRVGAAASLEVLLPPPDYRGGERAANDDSMALRLRYGDDAVLLTGDMQRPGEEWLLDHSVNVASQVLKVGHHGSDTSSSPAFLAAVNPAVGIISSGRDNFYGHPAPAVVDRLRADGVRVYRTDEDGAVQVRLLGTAIEVYLWPSLP